MRSFGERDRGRGYATALNGVAIGRTTFGSVQNKNRDNQEGQGSNSPVVTLRQSSVSQAGLVAGARRL